MWLQFKSDLQAFVVSDTTIEPVVHHCIGDFHIPGEDLVKMTTQLVSDITGVKCTSEVKVVQLPVHVGDVVIEVTTHHYCSLRILLDDIPDDIGHSLRSIHLELLFTRFEVAIE